MAQPRSTNELLLQLTSDHGQAEPGQEQAAMISTTPPVSLSTTCTDNSQAMAGSTNGSSSSSPWPASRSLRLDIDTWPGCKFDSCYHCYISPSCSCLLLLQLLLLRLLWLLLLLAEQVFAIGFLLRGRANEVARLSLCSLAERSMGTSITKQKKEGGGRGAEQGGAEWGVGGQEETERPTQATSMKL